MTSRSPTDQDDSGTELTEVGSTRPTIAATSPNVDLELQPIVTNERGVLQWNTNVDTTTGGRTIVDTNGDDNWRPVLEGVMIQPQFEKMLELRSQSPEVRIITDALTFTVVPDRFEYERVGEEDVGEATFEGEPYRGPIYTFQLQVKEEESNSGGALSSIFQ